MLMMMPPPIRHFDDAADYAFLFIAISSLRRRSSPASRPAPLKDAERMKNQRARAQRQRLGGDWE